MEIKKTFKQIREFSIYGSVLLMRYPNTKMAYAIKKVQDKLLMIDEYNDKLEDIRIENCYTNEKGIIEYDIINNSTGAEVRQYKYTKEEMQKKVKAERELTREWNEKTFDIEPHFATESPKDLSEAEKEVLEGFVLKAGEETPVVPSDDIETEEEESKESASEQPKVDN